MKSFNFSAQIIWVAVVCLSAPVIFAGTAFTYQGRLLENNTAAGGLYDLQFKLYDDPNVLVGSPVGSPVLLEDLEVIDGYFIAQLDFGGSAFGGDTRWLEIAVRPYDSIDPNDFVAQSPLQEITSAPTAMYAASSGTFETPISVTASSDEPLLRLENTGWGWGVYALTHGPWSALYGYHYDDGNMASIGTPDAGIVATSSSDYAGIFNGKTKVSGDFTVEDSGNVGIGTTSPAIDLAIGDTDTGLQQQGDGQLAVYTNNTERVRINSAGNVGIGTSSPAEELEVNGTVKATAFTGDGSGLTGIAYSESDPQVGTNSADYIPRWDGSTLTSGSILDNGTRVGIGSLVAQLTQFQVQNDSFNHGIFCDTNFTVNSAPYEQAQSAITGLVRGDTTWPSYGLKGSSSNSIGPSYGVRGDATLDNTGTNFGIFGKAFNNGSGNAWAGYFEGRGYFDKEVGIGTENPSSQLDIKSSSSVFISLERGANQLGGINWKETFVSGTQWIFPFFRGWQSDNLIVRDEASLLDVMTFEAGTGRVGIGTNTPAGKLDVNGSIYQRGSSLHADYVFEPDYDLESIEEHADFMYANKHLKSIPKAQTDENGVEVLEVGAHRKGIVEELEKAHIYINQLNEENIQLRERLDMLEQKMNQLLSAGQ